MKITEKNFIDQLKRQNEDALEYVVENYGGTLKSVISRILYMYPQDAEECLYDCIMKIWQKILLCDEKVTSFRNWAISVAKFTAIDRLRKINCTEPADNIDDLPISSGMDISDENYGTKKITYKKRRVLTVAAIAAAMAIIVPTSAYAYSRYSAHIYKTNKYQNTVVIKPTEKATDSGEQETDYKYWRFTYLPEGMEKDERDFKYRDHESGASVSPTIYYLPYNGNEIQEEMNFSANCDNYESDGKTVMINYRLSYEEEKDDPRNFGRVVWIAFNETDYVLALYISNGLSLKELYKIIDGTEFYSIGEDTFHEIFGYGSYRSEDDNYSEESIYNEYNKITPDECSIYTTGQFMEFPGYGDFRIRVNTVEITDSFDGITTDALGDDCDFSCWADENNNILKNTRTWYKYGDGISTVDEDICSFDMPYHIIKLNLTAENLRSDFNEIMISSGLVYFNPLSGTITQYEDDLNTPDGYSRNELRFRDSIFNKYRVDFGGYISLDSDEKNYRLMNNIGLESGESADFQICFICSENMMNDLYFSFNGVVKDMPLFKIEK